VLIRIRTALLQRPDPCPQNRRTIPFHSEKVKIWLDFAPFFVAGVFLMLEVNYAAGGVYTGSAKLKHQIAN